MTHFDVYQIPMHLHHAEVNEKHWDGAAKDNEAVEAYLATSVDYFDGIKWEERFFKHYDVVATVEAEDLSQVMYLLNVWPEDAPITIPGDARPHSLSIGDILVTEHGDRFMVDRTGFKKI